MAFRADLCCEMLYHGLSLTEGPTDFHYDIHQNETNQVILHSLKTLAQEIRA